MTGLSFTISITQMTQLLGVSRTTLHRMVQDGEIVQPIRKGGLNLGWSVDDYMSWIRSL